MASIERTAYPRFKKVVSERELDEVFTPTPDEVSWADEATRSDGNAVALLVLLRSFQRLGYFPRVDDIPDGVIPHVGKHATGVSIDAASMDAPRKMERYRVLVRQRVGVIHDPATARQVAAGAIRTAAGAKDNPADLINVALEELVKARYELPGYTTLDEMTA